MNHRTFLFFAAVLGLAWPGIASANAVLIEGAEGQVVRTLRQDIQIQVQAQVATTTVTTHFEPLTEPHALFCIGVPDQAAAYELVMIIDGEEIAADTAVGDPGDIPEDMTGWIAQDLVAYLGDNPLRTWVHGLEPGTEVAFRLTYVELLPYSFGLVTYTFPMIPFAGDTNPVEELTIGFELLTERTIESFEINHPAAEIEEVSDAHVIATSAEEMVPRYQDLIASYQVRQSGVGMRLWAYRPAENPWVDEYDGYFLLLLEPPTESDEVSDKVFTYVLDRSGSMSGDKIVAARDAAITAITELNGGDHFNIVAFDDDIEFFAGAPVGATWDQRAQAIDFLEGIRADGSTALHAALMAGLSEDAGSLDLSESSGSVGVSVADESIAPPPPRGGCNAFLPPKQEESGDAGIDPAIAGLPRVMLFLTDGLPTAGLEDPQRILEEVTEANTRDAAIYSVSIGHDADFHFLTALSEQNRGSSVQVLKSHEIQAQLEELFFRINNPLLIRPGVEILGGAVHDRLPQELPDLFLGNQLVIVGRYGLPGPATITLTGELDGEQNSYVYEGELPSIDEQNTFVGRIWAVSMVRHLLSVIEAEGETEELVDRIIALGLAYGINTPYTPFTFDPQGDDDDDDDDTGDDDVGDDDDLADDDDTWGGDDDTYGGDDDTYVGDDDQDGGAHETGDADCSCRVDGLSPHRSLIGPLLLTVLLALRLRRRG